MDYMWCPFTLNVKSLKIHTSSENSHNILDCKTWETLVWVSWLIDCPKCIHVLHPQETRKCVTLCGLAIHIQKYLKAKEELWQLKYFTMQRYNLHTLLKKKIQNPSRYYNSITNLKFQHKPPPNVVVEVMKAASEHVQKANTCYT
jgi:hypothetical protein